MDALSIPRYRCHQSAQWRRSTSRPSPGSRPSFLPAVGGEAAPLASCSSRCSSGLRSASVMKALTLLQHILRESGKAQHQTKAQRAARIQYPRTTLCSRQHLPKSRRCPHPPRATERGANLSLCRFLARACVCVLLPPCLPGAPAPLSTQWRPASLGGYAATHCGIRQLVRAVGASCPRPLPTRHGGEPSKGSSAATAGVIEEAHGGRRSG